MLEAAQAWVHPELAQLYSHSSTELGKATVIAACRAYLAHVDSRMEVPASRGQLKHATRFAQPLLSQYGIILHKNFVSYWRYPQYNAARSALQCNFWI